MPNNEALLKKEVEELKSKLKACQDAFEKEKRDYEKKRALEEQIKEYIRLGY